MQFIVHGTSAFGEPAQLEVEARSRVVAQAAAKAAGLTPMCVHLKPKPRPKGRAPKGPTPGLGQWPATYKFKAKNGMGKKKGKHR